MAAIIAKLLMLLQGGAKARSALKSTWKNSRSAPHQRRG